MENFNHTFRDQYVSLLKFNTNNTDVSAHCDVMNELRLYYDSLQNFSNYVPVGRLEDWISKTYNYPEVHPHHQAVIDNVITLKPLSVCEVGAGCGQVAKYVYDNMLKTLNSNENFKLTTVEWNIVHYQQMYENFKTRHNILQPFMEVDANMVIGSSHKLPFDDNSFDLIYTCTLMMHVPYIPAIASICEIARVTKKYVLHIENCNEQNNAVYKGKTQSDMNILSIDYEKIYKHLGFKILLNKRVQDPHVSCEYTYFLAEKL
jgi:ubiquinone/menaquinone biosynthesis C-methylase UbiE